LEKILPSLVLIQVQVSQFTRAILVTVSTAHQADEVTTAAKKLRKSSDPTISNHGVYINQFMPRIEAQLAYKERCKRRSKPNRTSVTAANININNNKTSTTIVVTNSSPIQHATQQLSVWLAKPVCAI